MTDDHDTAADQPDSGTDVATGQGKISAAPSRKPPANRQNKPPVNKIDKSAKELGEANSDAENLASQLTNISGNFASQNSAMLGGICGGSTLLGAAYCTAAAIGATTFVFGALAPLLIVSGVSGTILLFRGTKSLKTDREHDDQQRKLAHLKREFSKLPIDTQAALQEDFDRECRLILFGKNIDH